MGVSNLFREIMVDNFAGGGGTSMGYEMVTGRHVDIAINHDPDAIAMHEMNHPTTKHYQESVWNIDPVAAVNGSPVALAWFSPDCKHFSIAKGGKPVDKDIRGLAWVTVKWALQVKPRVIALENVTEFQSWGPIIDGRPDKSRAGETFDGFIKALSTGLSPKHPAYQECVQALGIQWDVKSRLKIYRGLGYKYDHWELKASEYGPPTIRKRFFLVARRDGRPVVKPKPTHAPINSLAVKNNKLLPEKTAADCVDFSIPTISIFNRQQHGKRDLAKNTLRRIGKGIQRFVVDTDEPFIVKANHTSNKTVYECFRGQPLSEPLQTITQSPGFAFVKPFISRQFGQSIGHGIMKPSGAITSGGGGKSVLVAAHMTKFRQHSVGFSMREPLHTICAGGESRRPGTAITQGVVCAHLSPQYGGGYTGDGQPMEKPTPTVTAIDHTALVTSHLVQLRGQLYGRMMHAPVPALTAGGTHLGLVNAKFIVKYYGTNFGHRIDDPMQTVTSKHRFALASIKQINPPLTDEQRYDAWMCARFMDEYGPDAGKPAPIIPGPRRRWITARNGGILIDIHLRMLEPRELYRAQGFPDDYIIDRDIHGNAIPKYKQVARCGNAVPPGLAAAIIRANLPEICQGGDLYDEDKTRRRAA